MRRKLMGFLPVSSIPFSRIYGISPVTDTLGSYKYKVFKKENRYGKGILVSCAYGKNDDPNAIAFVNEVITPIHQLLATYDAPDDFKVPIIDNYEFFNVVGGAYTIKKNKTGSIIFGLTLLVIGIHELTPDAWLGHEINLGRICFLMFMLIGGPAIILAGLTEVTFDRGSRLLTRKNPIGWGNKTYSFDDYNGVQTVRKSTNLIYTGTDVQVYFLQPQSQKEEVLVLQSFFSTRKVEKFIAELNTIMS
ncbi:hypothetical protein [Pedobacter jamesrossensis]|uniref:PH domain-containing protein n=2 Tax=Pedobacter jamesrossensis TaxID=1908238 RepID=A0ABV8NNV1_9SPHI